MCDIIAIVRLTEVTNAPSSDLQGHAQTYRELQHYITSCTEITRTCKTVRKMDEYQSGEETAFIVDEISGIIKESIEAAIGGNAYQPSRVSQWTTSVVELCLSQLTKLGKPFKYIVTSVIMQKNGAGLHTASSCYWDNNADGSCTVRWENKTMFCIVSVFGLGI
ncbi:dynein light chain Tctex-type 1-like [Chiloscyllium plagiosum]|nr:dynein light chain Tctex-type 1-like [Chiloscyllium plagiosum]